MIPTDKAPSVVWTSADDDAALAIAAAATGPLLAATIAALLGRPSRGASSKLQALCRRGLLEATIVKERASMRSDHLYGYQITDTGREYLRSRDPKQGELPT